MRAWALLKIPGYDFEAETENFIDWWRSKAGAAAVKADWPATWRTWMRKNAREAAERSPGTHSANGNSRRQGHQTFRNPADQSDYDTQELRPS